MTVKATSKTTATAKLATAEATRAELEAQLAAIEADEVAQAEHRVMALDRARDYIAERIVENSAAAEDVLAEESREAYEATMDALKAGDLAAGFAGYIEYQARHTERILVRESAQQAAHRLNVTAPRTSTLSDREFNFTSLINQYGRAGASNLAADRFEAAGEWTLPATWDDVEALAVDEPELLAGE